MSRSIKKTPITGFTTATTEKSNKRKANRKLRRVIKVEVKTDDKPLSTMKEISNVWAFNKDGKQFLKKPKKRI